MLLRPYPVLRVLRARVCTAYAISLRAARCSTVMAYMGVPYKGYLACVELLNERTKGFGRLPYPPTRCLRAAPYAAAMRSPVLPTGWPVLTWRMALCGARYFLRASWNEDRRADRASYLLYPPLPRAGKP
eukprot:3066280-Rhodomonas_salina.3